MRLCHLLTCQPPFIRDSSYADAQQQLQQCDSVSKLRYPSAFACVAELLQERGFKLRRLMRT